MAGVVEFFGIMVGLMVLSWIVFAVAGETHKSKAAIIFCVMGIIAIVYMMSSGDGGGPSSGHSTI
jgi:hypothetical protein